MNNKVSELSEAINFYRASIVIDNHIIDLTTQNNINMPNLFGPYCVLLLHSLELILKALIKNESDKDYRKTHNFEDLFNAVPTKTRTILFDKKDKEFLLELGNQSIDYRYLFSFFKKNNAKGIGLDLELTRNIIIKIKNYLNNKSNS